MPSDSRSPQSLTYHRNMRYRLMTMILSAQIEVRRAVKEHKQAVDKGAMRFHPKWGYVPNDVKPKRYGNRVNGKRSKKFVW